MLKDDKELLKPSLDAVKPVAPATKIAPEHIITDGEIDKIYQKIVAPGP